MVDVIPADAIDDILLAIAAILTAVGAPVLMARWQEERAERHRRQEHVEQQLAALHDKTDTVTHEVTHNSGGSMKDSLARIEARLESSQADIVARLHELREDVTADRAETRRLSSRIDRLERNQ